MCGAITALLHGAANLTSAEHGGRRRPVRRLCREPRADAPRDADASRRGRGDRRRRARSICKDAARKVWDDVLDARPQARLPQRPGDGARADRHDQLHDGLRHDRHRARHRPGEVQAARRRRHAEDRQPHRAAGPADARLRRAADRGDHASTSTRTTRSKGPRTCKTSTCRSSTVPSSRPTACRSIAWRAHVRMMAAAQPFLSGAICKTVNMPTDVDAERHRRRLHLGLEARPEGARDLSRRLEAKPAAEHQRARTTRTPKKDQAAKPRRERLPDTRQSITHKFNVGGHEGYINVGMFADGRPASSSSPWRRKGRTVGGLMDAFGTAISHAPAVRRAARSPGQQVLAHAVRADGPHDESRHSHRQERGRLHLPLDGHRVHPRLPRTECRLAAARGGPRRRRRCAGGRGARG